MSKPTTIYRPPIAGRLRYKYGQHLQYGKHYAYGGLALAKLGSIVSKILKPLTSYTKP